MIMWIWENLLAEPLNLVKNHHTEIKGNEKSSLKKLLFRYSYNLKKYILYNTKKCVKLSSDNLTDAWILLCLFVEQYQFINTYCNNADRGKIFFTKIISEWWIEQFVLKFWQGEHCSRSDHDFLSPPPTSVSLLVVLFLTAFYTSLFLYHVGVLL